MNFKKTALALAVLASLTVACGGGSTPATGSDTTLSGTVAGGAPLSGFVAVKDSSGTVVTATIDADGQYSLEAAQLTPPLLLFASGVAGGHAYSIASVATRDDLGGTLNVTPLTDLIVANVAGQDSASFFNNPDFGKLDRTAIDAAANVLKARLLPVLQAAGADPNGDLDLLHTAFRADHSGLDGVLDLLNVSVNNTTATISYNLDGAVAITDDLTDAGDNSQLPGSASGMDLDTDIGAVRGIAQMLNDFDALFAAGTPTSSDLIPYFNDNFLLDGMDKSAAIGQFTSTDATTVEATTNLRERMRRFALVGLDASASPNTATIRFGAQTIGLTNNGDGWQFAGNGRDWGADIASETHHYLSDAHETTELNLHIGDDYGKLDNNDYFIVTGPGLPANGIVMVQYDFNNFGNAASTNNMIYGHPLNDSTAASIPDGSDYTFTRYNDANGDTNVYAASATPVTVSDATTLTNTGDDVLLDSTTTRLLRHPHLSSEEARFPTITAPTDSALSAFTSGTLEVTWTLPAGSRNDDVTFDRSLQDGTYQRADEVWPTAIATSAALNVAAPGSTVLQQQVTVFTQDAFGRVMATDLDVNPGQSSSSTGGGTSTSDIHGVWRYVTSTPLQEGTTFQYLVVMDDNTYLYAEYDPNVQTATENGLEVGSYVYDSGTNGLTLTVNYDDNIGPGECTTDGNGDLNFSGSGCVGAPSNITAAVNGNGQLDIGPLTLSPVDFSSASSPVMGVWRYTDGSGEFVYLALFPDYTFLNADKYLNVSATENGVELGNYSVDNDTGAITFNLTYDDNTIADGTPSGVGSIGTPTTVVGVLSNDNNTLTVDNGSLVLTRVY